VTRTKRTKLVVPGTRTEITLSAFSAKTGVFGIMTCAAALIADELAAGAADMFDGL
jgi:hypothetical protein